MRARGQASVAWTARPGVVVRTVLSHSAVVFTAITPPVVVALVEGTLHVAAALLPAAVACIAGHLLARRQPLPDDVRQIEAALSFVALFVLTGALCVPAFMALGMPAVDAVFESVSGITSTGLTVAADASEWPFAGHFLRSWLQWIGGFAIAVAGVALILGPGGVAHRMGEVGIGGRDIVSSTRAQARALLTVYCILSGLALVILVPLMPTWWEGVLIALSAVSTGGFTPRPDSLASYSTSAQVVVLLICASTTLSLNFYVLLRHEGLRNALRRSNCAPVLLALVGGALLTVVVKLTVGGHSPDAVRASVLNFISGFTTAGFSVAPVADADAVVALILVAMLIGGGVGSTAGGIKLDRALTLAQMIGLSLLRLRSPRRSLTRLRADGRTVHAERIVAIAAIVVLYCVTGFVAWMMFLASGMPPLASIFDVVSALSTVGLSSGVTGVGLAVHLKIVLIIAMLAGRLEFLALLAFILPATWKRR